MPPATLVHSMLLALNAASRALADEADEADETGAMAAGGAAVEAAAAAAAAVVASAHSGSGSVGKLSHSAATQEAGGSPCGGTRGGAWGEGNEGNEGNDGSDGSDGDAYPLAPSPNCVLSAAGVVGAVAARRPRPRRPRPVAAPLARGRATPLATLQRALLAVAQPRRVALVTPELGRWSSVGGLATMVSHLAGGLAARGSSVCVLAPAYECYKARWASLPVERRLHVPCGRAMVSVDVRCACEGGVAVYLLESARGFAAPYPAGDTSCRLRPAVLLARAALLVLDALDVEGAAAWPQAIITNDWVAGLVVPYARHAAWAGAAAGRLSSRTHSTLVVHLVHNLEPGYDGRLAIDAPVGHLSALHELPPHWLHERPPARPPGTPPGTPAAAEHLSLTRAALLGSSAWGTVSAAYRDALLATSSYAPLLHACGGAIACDSGLPLSRRRAELAGYGDHPAAKVTLQRRCFGEAGVRPSTPLLLFLGRVSYQKGVHLLLDCVAPLLQRARGGVQLCVCGLADPSDPYARRCAAQMAALRAAYPAHFWADPARYFEESALASLAADFGLMPSIFEPSGLVREEFFAAGTPLVCSTAGGLGQRVVPYNAATRCGAGLPFASVSHSALLATLERALALYAQPEHYAALRRNAHAAACDVSETAWHWQCEIERLLACQQPTWLHEGVLTATRAGGDEVAAEVSGWDAAARTAATTDRGS